MYSQIHGEIHYPDCEQRRRMQSGGRNSATGSRVGSSRFSGRSCVQDVCPDCGKIPKYPPRMESFAFRQSVDEIIGTEWMKHFYMPRQEELPFCEQTFPNSHYVYNSTVMTQTPPEIAHCQTSPMLSRQQDPALQSSFDSSQFSKNKAIIRRKKPNGWKRSFKAVKPHAVQKPLTADSKVAKPKSPNTEKKLPDEHQPVAEIEKLSPKFSGDGKGDGAKIAEEIKAETPKEVKSLNVLPPAITVQRVTIPEELELPKSSSIDNHSRISDKHSAKSSEKVNTWMRKQIFYKKCEPQPSASNESRNLLKKTLPSIAEMSREEHLKQLHQCIRTYIEYLQKKNDVAEAAGHSQSGSTSDANIVQVDADSLLNVFSHPLRQIASDLNLTVTQSVTDAVINADGKCPQDPVAQIMKLRNKQYEKVCDKLREFFSIVRLLDDVSGLSKKQSQASSLSKIGRDVK